MLVCYFGGFTCWMRPHLKESSSRSFAVYSFNLVVVFVLFSSFHIIIQLYFWMLCFYSHYIAVSDCLARAREFFFCFYLYIIKFKSYHHINLRKESTSTCGCSIVYVFFYLSIFLLIHVGAFVC